MAEWEELLAAIRVILKRASDAREFSLVLEEGPALADVRELTEALQQEENPLWGDLNARFLLGWLHWYRFSALPEGEDREDLDASIAMFLPCFITGNTKVPEPLLPILAAEAVSTATAWLQNDLAGSGGQNFLVDAARLWQLIVDATPTDDPYRPGRLANLGNALRARFERYGNPADLDAAVLAGRQSVEAHSADHPERAVALGLLGISLWTRFKRAGAPADLDAAIETFQAVVVAMPTDHPDRGGRLSILGDFLRARFDRTGDRADLSAGVNAYRQAVESTPADHRDYAAHLNDLAITLRSRFEHAGDANDLDAAIETGRRAAEAVPADHPDRVAILSNLGNALRARFERTDALTDLDAAVQVGRRAVDATPAGHPDLPIRLSNLGSTLRVLYSRTGDMRALDEAIRVEERAGTDIPLDHSDRAKVLHNLGAARWARFRRLGMQADLDAAIEVSREAVDATPAGYPAHPLYLTQLGGLLRARFARTGDVDDLDAAVRVCRRAAEATPGGHRDRAGRLSNLGGALLDRFERTGARDDLEAAVRVAREAVGAMPADHPDRAARLNGLGRALSARFERTGEAHDLDAAVDAYRQAADATPPDHPDRTWRLSSLGNALKTRGERTGDRRDLDAAVLAGRRAVEAAPADHPDRAGLLSNLSTMLESRFEHTGDMSDVDAAVQVSQEAVELVPTDHPDRAAMLSNLGTALRTRFGRTGDTSDREAALAAYAEAARIRTAAPTTRVHTGRAAASLAMAGSRAAEAADLLEGIVRLLPEVAPRHLERDDRQYAISAFAGLAAEAAEAVLSDPAAPDDERPVRALRALEGARAVLLSQTLSTRSDLTDLRRRHPELAEEFVRLRDLLDRPTEPLSPPTGPPATAQPGDGEPGGEDADAGGGARRLRDRRYAAAELTRLLARIRALDGFAGFARPPAPEQLMAQAADGPVAVFNIGRRRSDALLLTGTGVTALELPRLAHDEVIDRIIAFHRALAAATDTGADRTAAQAEIREILGWLWDTAAEPVLDTLGHRRPPASGQEWPRVWWAPGGLLSLLPIHAAGHYSLAPDPGHRAVMDRVVSSYTPTVGALAHARRAMATPRPVDRSLIVAMPTTPGQGELPNVRAEVDMLCARLPGPVLLEEPDEDAPRPDRPVPTKPGVLRNLTACAIAHFACHGHNDPVDPSRSRLLLHDHREDPLTVAALETVSLDDARLAYLSACSTAFTSRTDLLDEAIHLASAFQLAGFPHVIGTLWPINDACAVTIADDFYAALHDADGALDANRAAYALHQAVRAVRDTYPITPTLWAAHIHAGA